MAARRVLFLRSREPYEWLARTRWDEVKVLLGLQHRYRGGDRAVWPFVSQGQLARVAARPPFGRPHDRAV